MTDYHRLSKSEMVSLLRSKDREIADLKSGSICAISEMPVQE